MKVIFIAVLLVIALMLVGWVNVGSSDGDPTVSLDTQQVKADTQKAVEAGKELVAEGQELLNDTEDRSEDEPADKVELEQ